MAVNYARITLILVVFIVLGASFAVYNSPALQQTQKVYHVGIIAVPSFPDATKGFKIRMSELGYIENESIVYDAHDYDPVTARGILQKFVADKVDLIFAYSTAAALDAKTATQGTGIPVVFALVTVDTRRKHHRSALPCPRDHSQAFRALA